MKNKGKQMVKNHGKLEHKMMFVSNSDCPQVRPAITDQKACNKRLCLDSDTEYSSFIQDKSLHVCHSRSSCNVRLT